MLWLIGGSSEIHYGNQSHKYCPNCQEKTPCLEVVASTTGTVWFVPVTHSSKILGYECQICEHQFKPSINAGCMVAFILLLALGAIIRACEGCAGG